MKITFIGGGNMASALLSGLLNAGETYTLVETASTPGYTVAAPIPMGRARFGR